MTTLNTPITYPLLLLLSSAKRSFAGLGAIVRKSGDTIKRLLPSTDISWTIIHKIAQKLFANENKLTLSIDDTLLRKIYAQVMVGSGRFFDTKLGKKITAYRLMVAALTNGKFTVPISCGFMFAKELLEKGDVVKTKMDYIKIFFACAQRLFPNTKIKIATDGLFASIEFFTWCFEYRIEAVTRMHSNRVVIFNNKPCKITQIACLKPRGRQMARTIKVTWHGLPLYLTAERRINKHGIESLVYLAATYKIRPIQYVKDYKLRWPIEKVYRTGKQSIGLAECFSTELVTQEKHIAAAFLAYAIAQLHMKNRRIDTPEQAIRAIKHKNVMFWIRRFIRSDPMFSHVHA